MHYCELALNGDKLVTAGNYGWAMVVTGIGESVSAANQNANHLADRVLIPNVRFRRDIGDRLLGGELSRLERLGIFKDESVVQPAYITPLKRWREPVGRSDLRDRQQP
jgi:phosphoribosylamine--glycine ligase